MFTVTRMTNGPMGPNRLMTKPSKDKFIDIVKELRADNTKSRVWIVRDGFIYCAWAEGDTCTVIEFEHEVEVPEVIELLQIEGF